MRHCRSFIRDSNISGTFNEKVDIEPQKTSAHVWKLFDAFGCDGVFGSSDVTKLLGIQHSGASKFLKKLLEANLIEPVSGMGKGKYIFKL